MSQFKDFNVVVTNGSTTVRAIWEVSIGTITGGPYTVGEGLTWGTTGVGTHVIDQSGKMRLYRTAGEEPESGDTITGGTSGATCVISDISVVNQYGIGVNPPRFYDSPSQSGCAAGDGFVVNAATAAAVYQDLGTVTSSHRDYFPLAVAWTGPTLVDVPAYITRDFTANNDYPLPNPGDARAATIIAKALKMIDTVVVAAGWKDVDSDSVSGWQGNWDDKGGTGDFTVKWRHEFGRVIFSGAAERTPNFTSAQFDREAYQWVKRATVITGVGGTSDSQHIEWDTVLGYENTIVEANVTTPVNQTSGVYSKGRFRLNENGLYVLKAHIHQCQVANTVGDMVKFQFRDVTTGTPAVIGVESYQTVAASTYDNIGFIDQHNLMAYFEVTGAPTTKPLIDLYMTEIATSNFTSLRANCSWMTVQYFNPLSSTEQSELLFTLPVGDRPRHKVIAPVQEGYHRERIEIDTDGTVRYKGYGIGDHIDLSHVSFTVS